MIRLTLIILALALGSIFFYGSGLAQERDNEPFFLDPGEDKDAEARKKAELRKQRAQLDDKLRRNLLEAKRLKYMDELADLQQQIDQLIAAGRRDETRTLQMKAQDLKKMIEELDPSHEVKKLEQRIVDLKRCIDDLHHNGHHEEAVRQEKELHLLSERLVKLRFELHEPDDDIAQLRRRLELVRTAADNLHAAGMHKQAVELDQNARQIEKAIQCRILSPTEIREVYRVEELTAMVQKLRAEVQALKIVVKELQKRVQELSGENKNAAGIRENLKALGYSR